MALSITHSYVSAVPDAGDASLVQPSDWNDTHDISGLGTGVEAALAVNLGSAGAVLISTSTIPLTIGSSTIASGTDTRILYNNAGTLGEYTLAGTGTVVAMQTAPSFLTSITTPIATITQGTITADAPQINGTVTWNQGATAFSAWKLDVTNTASADASYLLDFQVGSVKKFNVGLHNTGVPYVWLSQSSPSGTNYLLSGGTYPAINAPSGGGVQFSVSNAAKAAVIAGGFIAADTSYIAFGDGFNPAIATPDVVLYRDAANTLALRNSTTAQTFRVYETADGSPGSNYSRLAIKLSSNIWTIIPENAGTGSGNRGVDVIANGTLRLGSNGGEKWSINTSGDFLLLSDNVSDIGASGATRPRTGYFGTSVVTPIATITQGTITDSAPQINGTVTWNDGTEAFTGWRFNATHTASAANSRGIEIQAGGTTTHVLGYLSANAANPGIWLGIASGSMATSNYALYADGTNCFLNAPSGGRVRIRVSNSTRLSVGDAAIRAYSDAPFEWSTDDNVAGDVRLYRDAAATLALRNATTAQTFRVYNTADGSPGSNFERGILGYSSNVLQMGHEHAGTGISRAVSFYSGTVGSTPYFTIAGSTGLWSITTAVHLVPLTDNIRDVGLINLRPRDLYAGSSLYLGGTATTFAGREHTLVVRKTGIADATATAIITVTVPNAAHNAAIFLNILGHLGTGTDASESSRTATGSVVIARTSGADTVAVVSTLEAAQIATVSGGGTLTLAYDLSTLTGASSATQTFTIRLTLTVTGTITDHTAVISARLLNSLATGVTMAAA
jgi:hypothetical protein